ncbi:MAG: hypothetical protein GC162_15670 [Planctomycetes bacterium]|nr:hypothetical protein [Planctomycetota bacterium]
MMLRRRDMGLTAVLLWGIMLICVDGVFADARPLDEAMARQAYQVAENWVRRARVPESTLEIEAGDVIGVHVTLRIDGPTRGQGMALVADPLNPPESINVLALLRNAVNDALKDLVSTLERPIDDLAPAAAAAELDIQFAHRLSPVRIARLDELPSKLAINLDGLAMHAGGAWAWTFPGNRIAANTNMQGQLNRLLSDVKLPLTKLREIAQPGGPELYRFSVIHLAQMQPGAEPNALYRGNLLWPAVPLDDAALKLLTEQLADNLLRRARDNGQFAGTYEPTADAYNPVTARAADAALAAFALSRVAKLPMLDEDRRRRATDVANAAVIELTGEEHDLPDTALTLLALLETPGASQFKGPRLRLATTLGRMQTPDGRFNFTDEAGAHVASLSADALATAALVAYYDRTRDPQILAQIKLALAALWKQADGDDDKFASTLPWLAYAEMDLARLDQASAHLPKLHDACERLLKQQVKPWTGPIDEAAPADTVGGFTIATGITNEPNWQSARALAALAIGLRDPRVVPDADRPRWLVDAGLASRFITQLTMQTPSCYYTRNRTEALGGTRLALWDNREPLYATAMSLLAVTELEHTLTKP